MKIFSLSLKRQMKDCILAILWPRDDIYKFFENHNCPANVLKNIRDWKDNNFSRSMMIEKVFDALQLQPDNGTHYFDQMLMSLVSWDHFDKYWFETQSKLNLIEAKQKILKLKNAKDENIDKVKDRISRHKKISDEKIKKHDTLEEMQNEFNQIATGKMTPQNRGYAFEKFLVKMAKFYNLTVTNGFRLDGTQIDGSIKFDGENYNIEAKWQDRALSDEPIMTFCHKQEILMHARGIFISINGVTEGALNMLKRGNQKNTIIIDGEDIAFVMNDYISFTDLLDVKIRAAQTRGDFYIHPITGVSKIK